MGERFLFGQRIRFAHCDPSGIVYFPNYVTMINNAIEDWFEHGLGLPFDDFHLRRRLGIPVVNTRVDFLAPCRLGEQLEIGVAVERMGRSSIELGISGTAAGTDRLRARHRIAVISLDRYRSIPIPEYMRAVLQRYAVDPPLPETPAPATHDGTVPGNAFRKRTLVRFAHCDPAGIVYNPRFFDMFVEALEHWFQYGLGSPLGALVNERGLGVPTLTITVEFLRACRMGEFLDFDLWVQKLGRSSIGIALAGSVEGEPRLRAVWTACLLDQASFKSVPIPADLRKTMEQFVS